MSNKFLYFAYGSNLLKKRIHINNPSAVRAGIGKIKDFQLDFNSYSKNWKGCSATIVPREKYEVWGAIWEIDEIHMETLDKQEGVHQNLYYPLEIDVYTPSGDIKKCRVYQQTILLDYTKDIEKLPDDRKPSTVYLNIIIKGAEESGLPEKYQNFLKKIPHNGYDGEVNIGTELHLI